MKSVRARIFPLLILGLLLALAGESLSFFLILNEKVPWYFPVTGLLADLFWPACLLACALFSASAVFYVAFACSAGMLLFLKTANICLFRNTFEIISAANLQLLLEHTDLFSLRLMFGPLYWLKIAAVFLGFAALIYLLAWSGIGYAKERTGDRAPHKARVVVLILILLSIAANTFYHCHSEEWGKGYFQREFTARPAEVQITDIILEYRRVDRTFLEKDAGPGFFPDSLPGGSEDILRKWGILPRVRSATKPSAVPELRKIIVIAVESLDFAFLRANNPAMPEGITPFMDSLSQQYLSFRNYFTGSQPTSWAMDCIFLSRPDYTRDLALKNVSICDILREKGWPTWYFSPASGYCFDNGRDYRRIFRPEYTVYQEEFFLTFGYKGTHYWGLGDDQMFDGTFRFLTERAGDRFFCVISTIDLHDPYTVTGPAASLESTGTRFLDALRSTDRNLQLFLERVMGSPLYDEHTLIVLTADHSSTFGANYTKRTDFLPARIPLIFISPNKNLRKMFDPDRFGSQLDLAPTLLSLLGIPAPETFMGRDLRIAEKNYAVAKTVDMIRLYLPDGRIISCPLIAGQDPSSPEERALRDYLRLFYGPSVP